jgi:hypothetical protein
MSLDIEGGDEETRPLSERLGQCSEENVGERDEMLRNAPYSFSIELQFEAVGLLHSREWLSELFDSGTEKVVLIALSNASAPAFDC